MDFNPDHEKWQCCCCHVVSGLKILSVVELVASILFLGVFGYNAFTSEKRTEDFVFAITLLGLCLATAISSALLVAGLFKLHAKLMYPSVAVRVAIVIFVAVFGVSHIVLRPDEDDYSPRNKPHSSQYSGQPSMIARLVFLIFIMLTLCCVVFYTIFLIMNAIKYVTNMNKLKDRRQSLINASQIAKLT
ncbi:unnamed protein product [Bursaphelenchus okinawaensis]|uniref:DUF7027 domain-containing protein n=1 Tax=Bursaphelenchus okinawaensis TaxID=465554 RepID=A0A811JSE8_9BILA|nr:unnamed protein product [Bursaphelenchus okinawaensis]CAG9080868.1 unnamed protein product [Bursaphelenchus okinawaensis]